MLYESEKKTLLANCMQLAVTFVEMVTGFVQFANDDINFPIQTRVVVAAKMMV